MWCPEIAAFRAVLAKRLLLEARGQSSPRRRLCKQYDPLVQQRLLYQGVVQRILAASLRGSIDYDWLNIGSVATLRLDASRLAI